MACWLASVVLLRTMALRCNLASVQGQGPSRAGPSTLHIGTPPRGPPGWCQGPVRCAGLAVAFRVNVALDCDLGLQLAACPSSVLECMLVLWCATGLLLKLFLFRYEHLWSNSLVLAEGKMNSNLCPPIRQQTF